MAHSHPKRRAVAGLTRRGLACTAPVPMRRAGRALIVRWIGAAALKRRKAASRAAGAPPDPDTVVRLTWAQTFGRGPSRQAGTSDVPALIVAMRPRTDTLCA